MTTKVKLKEIVPNFLVSIWSWAITFALSWYDEEDHVMYSLMTTYPLDKKTTTSNPVVEKSEPLLELKSVKTLSPSICTLLLTIYGAEIGWVQLFYTTL